MNTIEIYEKSGVKKTMEIVTIFRIEQFKSNYIIYRELDKSKTYIAKYKGDKLIDFDTNISEKELKICNELFERIEQNEK